MWDWNDNLTQFARLLCELVANNESLSLEKVAEEMDLELKDVQELLDRAHKTWEAAKGNLLESTEMEAAPNERYWIGMGKADVGALFNEDGISIDIWRNGIEEAPVWSAWATWDDLLS